jgi:hypothetical protein
LFLSSAHIVAVGQKRDLAGTAPAGASVELLEFGLFRILTHALVDLAALEAAEAKGEPDNAKKVSHRSHLHFSSLRSACLSAHRQSSGDVVQLHAKIFCVSISFG